MAQEKLTRSQIIDRINTIRNERAEMRKQERQIVADTKSVQPVIADGGDLRSNLSKILPKYLLPTNVGQYKQILTPMWYQATHDLGNNPVYGPNLRSIVNFQVSQEAGFLMTGITREWRDRSSAGFKAPLRLTIRDNQSTRQFNNTGFTIQTIGYKGSPTYLETPLLLVPNASVATILESWLPIDFNTVGDGYHQFTFHGYRVNMGDVNYLAQQLFL